VAVALAREEKRTHAALVIAANDSRTAARLSTPELSKPSVPGSGVTPYAEGGLGGMEMAKKLLLLTLLLTVATGVMHASAINGPSALCYW
jgi:hypothetical protein